jgi:hypothetical protein
VFSVATKFALFLKRRPVLAALVLVVIALVAAKLGAPHGGFFGTWDGPV